MNRHYVTLSTFCLFLLSGCATEPTQRYQFLSESSEATSFSQSGQHKQAASLYQSLAKTKPAYQVDYNLLASESFVHSGDSQSAQSIIDSINPSLLTAAQRNKLNLVIIQISLSNGETEKALNQLQVTQPYNLSSADQIIFYQSLAFAHSLTGDLLSSTQARIQLTPLLESNQQRNENNTVILDTLSLLSSQNLSLQQPPAPDILGGWMALAKLLKLNNPNQNPESFQLAISEWQYQFPQHPANLDFILSYTEGVKNTFKIPSSIALLLPQSGRFAKAAELIKVGFMAAYQQSQTSYQPSIRFYDSSAYNPITLYHQAISDGAELVIGPLNKNNIQELALGTELPVPVLALNHIPHLAKDNLFQFGLSPIDESKQLASNASSKGLNKILVLTPESKQGHRIADLFSESWLETSGTVLETQHYKTKGGDFSTSIKALLNLDESQYRYKKIKQLLARNIEYTERRRTDVDAIFLSASAQKARSIYPHLQFYRATNVPVYATPQIYTGEPNPSADIDLNSITFCDVPWLFTEAYPAEPSQESLREHWQQLPINYLRLTALGIDSFNIISALEQISSIPFSGATGTLSLNMENRITRQLVCAKFINGRPVLQEASIENMPQ